MIELSSLIDRVLAVVTVAAPLVVFVALLWLVGARTYADAPPRPREEDPPPRWPLGN